MDLTAEQLKAKGFTDQEIVDYAKSLEQPKVQRPSVEDLKAKGFTDQELADYNSGTTQKTVSPIADATPKSGIQSLVDKLIPQSAREYAGEMASNIIPDAVTTAKGIGSAVLHPYDTAKNLGTLASGALESGVKAGIRHFSSGSAISERLRPPTPEEQMFTQAIGDPISKMVGEPSLLAQWVKEHPVQTAMNVSGLTGLAGKAAGVAGLSKTATSLGTVSEFTDPLALAGKWISLVRKGVGTTSIPEELYARTMKIPPGSLRDEGRQAVLKTLVRDEGLPLNSLTVKKINQDVGSLENKISGVLDSLSSKAPGVGTEIDVNSVVNSLDNIKKDYANRGNPEYYNRVIDRVKNDYIEHDFVKRLDQEVTTVQPSSILDQNGQPMQVPVTTIEQVPTGMSSIADANQLKKGIYAEIEAYYKKGQKPETGRAGIRNDVEAATKAKMASLLRDSIVSNPEVPGTVRLDLSRQAGLLNARKWVERATNRAGNLDVVSLSGMAFGVLVEKGLPGAIAYKIATSQNVLSRIAVGLAQGSKTMQSIGSGLKIGEQAGYQAGRFGDTFNNQNSEE